MSINYSKIELPPSIRLDCYRCALYPILNYYNCDADLLFILINSMLRYDKNLICKEDNIIVLNDLFLDFSLETNWFTLSELNDIIPSIKRMIDNEGMVICFLDVFYYSHFHSVYKNTHTDHAVPIYGYDDQKKIFYTIDTDYLESFERTYTEISYEDIINCMVGYSQLTNRPVVQFLKRKKEKLNIEPTLIRKKYINLYQERMRNSYFEYKNYINELALLCEYILQFSSFEKEMLNFSRQSYKHIDSFINNRMLEYYGIKYLFYNIENLQKNDMEIVEKCNFIRAIMYRTQYTGEYRKTSFEKFHYFFDSILNMEKERLEFINNFNWNDNIILLNHNKFF